MTNTHKCLLKIQGFEDTDSIQSVCKDFNCVILYHTDIVDGYIKITCELTDGETSITASRVFKNLDDWTYEVKKARKSLTGSI